ncbi:MAG TPA: NAD(P)/FAD-dependent oxidoreductase [Dehalococcoidia bacterium]|nr:NAD(P)/FAD-dependent oxidoreductase [Dehalococcoidia bacterium]
MERTYDALIIGGGPAGLSAAIYLVRFNRSVLVVDRGHGRSTSHEVNENYLGFPEGIASTDLRERGREQARRFGAEFMADDVAAVAHDDGVFRATSERREYRARTLTFATGASDLFPDFELMRDYVGRSLFWCITCDGFKVRDQRVVVVGHDDDAAVTAMQLVNFTERVSFVTNRREGESDLSDEKRGDLARRDVPLYEGCIADVQGDDGMMHSVCLDDGRAIEADAMFNQQGATPNSALAQSVGVATSAHGWITCDVEQRTNIGRVYAAGDVTRMFAHQIVTAAHEGSMAGQAANYDLYDPDQREE